MTRHEQTLSRNSATSPRAIALALMIAFALTAFATQAAQAQYTYKVLHNFSGGQDGGTPEAGVTYQGGNLYGTTYSYGAHGYGVVYELKLKGGTFNPLYAFSGNDGAYPIARVILGPDGAFYGTTYGGGNGYGVVFKLRPAASACKSAICLWAETVLYAFKGTPDGAYPGYGDLIFDQASDIYGTTSNGGTNNEGCVYELTPSGGGKYTEKCIYSFGGGSDGIYPDGGVILDSAGNLYGTTYNGGIHGAGTVFQLMPPSNGGSWTENLLHSFDGTYGSIPVAGLIFDQSGTNLYGVTNGGGTGGGGEVFEMTDIGNNNWSYTPIYGLTAPNGCGPYHTLATDGTNFYGATYCDGAHAYGNVFELSPSIGGWTYTDLYDFCSGGSPCTDGEYPITQVTLDGNGNLYGTTSAGGLQTVGVVWELVKN